jgi:hypothetical protein
MKAQRIEAAAAARRLGKRRRGNDLGTLTWNVLSLYRSGSLRILTNELIKYDPHIVALKEKDG